MDVRDELLEKLPAELQPYGLELLRRLATVHVAQPGLGGLIVATLPPGSVDSLVETKALIVEGSERRLTDLGRHVAELAHDHEWLLDDVDPASEPSWVARQPIPAARHVQDWLRAHEDDDEDVVRPRAAVVANDGRWKRSLATGDRSEAAAGDSRPARAR